MRRQVPYVGEKQIARADQHKELAARKLGNVIDEVVSTLSDESSWDDLVPSDWMNRKTEPGQVGITMPAGAAAMKASTPPTTPPPKARVPAGKSLQSQVPLVRSHASATASPTRTTTILYGDGPSLDWILINNGHGLRINVNGNIDFYMRPEWNRLLEETQDTQVSEYEFNLSYSPSLSLAGLGMLLLFRERKAPGKSHIALKNCSKDVAQLLHWTGMDKYFTIHSTQALDA